MAEENAADAIPASSARSGRPPPTIDLDAADVSGDTQAAMNGAGAARWRRLARAAGAMVMIPLLVAAATTLAGLYFFGGKETEQAPAPNPALALVNDLSARLARLEKQPAAAKPASNDPEIAARLNVAEQALQNLREQMTALRRQSEAATSAVNEIKSAPREPGAAPPAEGTSALADRLAALESRLQALSSELANPVTPMGGAREWRRAIAAMMLDTAVRSHAPYGDQFAAARALAADPKVLTPLEVFAASGLPDDAALATQFHAAMAKVAPLPSAPTGTWLERMMANAGRLVRVSAVDERASDDPAALLHRFDTLAQRHAFAAIVAEAARLSADQRAVAAPPLATLEARNAALAASQEFLREALAALAKNTP